MTGASQFEMLPRRGSVELLRTLLGSVSFGIVIMPLLPSLYISPVVGLSLASIWKNCS